MNRDLIYACNKVPKELTAIDFQTNRSSSSKEYYYTLVHFFKIVILKSAFCNVPLKNLDVF